MRGNDRHGWQRHSIAGGRTCGAEPALHAIQLLRQGHGIGGQRIAAGRHRFTQLRHGLHADWRGPWLNLRAAPIVVQNPNGHAGLGLDLSGEIETHSTESADALRRTHLPCGGGRRLHFRKRGLHMVELDAPYLGKIGRLAILGGIVRILLHPFHVGLSRTEPDISNDYVGQGN